MEESAILSRIEELLDSGDGFLDAGKFSLALENYREAASLIPGSDIAKPLALSVYTAIGEAYLYGGHYKEALDAFLTASQSPGAIENPLSHLRVGQAYFELGELKLAADELTKAYMLDGKDVFENEDPKYLSFLATRISI